MVIWLITLLDTVDIRISNMNKGYRRVAIY